MTSSRTAKLNAHYDAYFFDHIHIKAHQSASEVLPTILSAVKPKSIIDIGCATGTWLEICKKCGVSDILGIDWHDGSLGLRISEAEYRSVELERAGLSDVVGRSFDLAICLEVAEHLDESRGHTLVSELTALAPVVLFSAAIPGQGGTNHINEQWQSYWAREFEEYGYGFIDLRPIFWNNSRIAWWYRQNLVLYIHPDQLGLRSEFQKLALHNYLPDMVHPEVWSAYRFSTSEPSLRYLVRHLPRATRDTVRNRLNRRGSREVQRPAD